MKFFICLGSLKEKNLNSLLMSCPECFQSGKSWSASYGAIKTHIHRKHTGVPFDLNYMISMSENNSSGKFNSITSESAESLESRINLIDLSQDSDESLRLKEIRRDLENEKKEFLKEKVEFLKEKDDFVKEKDDFIKEKEDFIQERKDRIKEKSIWRQKSRLCEIILMVLFRI